MFVGHLAVALASKKVDPTLPLGPAVAAAFALDLLWPILLLVGLETVRVNPGDTAFTNLAFDSYPWSHSLVMAAVWSAVVGIIARRYMTLRASTILGALVLSHWVLDFVTHRPDLPLWPGGPVYGLGLWSSVPGTLLVEGAMLCAATLAYLHETRALDRIGTFALFGLIGLCTAIWATQPWAPLPPSAVAVAWGGLVLWLIPPWGSWIDRHRTVRGG
jgi:hypothetical protein